MEGKKAHKTVKGQSAVEYLMTYMWVLVVIAIAAAAFFVLAAYQPISQPKALPGSCEVNRPNGPYTTQFISLEGTCNNLPPKYVAGMLQSKNSHVIIQIPPTGANQLTITFWAHPNNTGQDTQNLVYVSGALPSNDVYSAWQNEAPSAQVPWQFLVIVLTAASPNYHLYVNGSLILSKSIVISTVNTVDIGGSISCPSCVPAVSLYGLNGQISNIQMYSTAFNANQINNLYLEGLGGAPTDLTQLVSWWPLNGDTIDYSGNGKSASSGIGLSFSGILTPSYMVP
jgi:hypothetical protein